MIKYGAWAVYGRLRPCMPVCITFWGDQVWRFGDPGASVAAHGCLYHFPPLSVDTDRPRARRVRSWIAGEPAPHRRDIARGVTYYLGSHPLRPRGAVVRPRVKHKSLAGGSRTPRTLEEHRRKLTAARHQRYETSAGEAEQRVYNAGVGA